MWVLANNPAVMGSNLTASKNRILPKEVVTLTPQKNLGFLLAALRPDGSTEPWISGWVQPFSFIDRIGSDARTTRIEIVRICRNFYRVKKFKVTVG